jgi:hypothetical protein
MGRALQRVEAVGGSRATGHRKSRSGENSLVRHRLLVSRDRHDEDLKLT